MRERRSIEFYWLVRLDIAVVWICVLLIGAVTQRPQNTWAIGQMAYQNPQDVALGMRGSASLLFFGVTGNTKPMARWQIEAGERRLFGIADVKVDGAYFALRHGRWGGGLAATHLATPVGSETVVSMEPFFFHNGLLGFAAGVNLARLSIRGAPGIHLATISARLFARLVDGFAVGYTVENIRVAGEPFSGADTAFYAVVFAGSPVLVLGRIEVARDGTVTAGIHSHARLGGHLHAAVGYDDLTGGFAGAVTCALGALGIRIGAELHPVLGVSQSVSLVIRGHGS